MDDQGRLTLFVTILLASTITMIVTVAVARRRAVAGYRVIAATAIAAFLAALHQVVTDRFGVVSLVLSGLLAALLTLRLVVNRWSRRVRPG